MSSRFSRALRGLVLLCLGFAALPAMAQVRHEGAIPDGRGGVGVLATGINHTCALRQDGNASCWGYDNQSGKIAAPAGPFMELSAGFEHTCGLRGDGTVECWGAGYSAIEGEPPPQLPPEMAGRFTALASGMGYTCGLRARALPWKYPEGNVACWTANGWGMPLPAPPPGDFAALSVGDGFACGLRADGRAECWGEIDAAAIPQESFIMISAGARHACALSADGSARCWGDNGDGQAAAPAELFTAISAGAFNTCGIRTDNSVQCWGANWAGQSTPPAPENVRFVAISSGVHHACGVGINGEIACWGNVDWGNGSSFPPQPYEGVFGIGELATGDWHQCQVLADGRLSCWMGMPVDPFYPDARFSAASSGWDSTCARNADGRLQCIGNNSMMLENLPIEPLRQFDIGYEHGCGVLALDGRARCWGRETNGKTLAPEGLFRDLSAGLMHSCGVGADGNGQCWGYGGDGQTIVPQLPPEQRFLSIKAGERHSCGLDSALHIKCWGISPPPAGPADPYNPDPQYNPDFATFRALSAGAYHSCAIRTDGTLLCWGENWSGQLNAPEGSFVSVSAGHDYTCAIRTDGRRECWGGPWANPRLTLDPESIPGVRTGQWLDVRFDLRGEWPYQLQEPRFVIVAGSLPPGIRLEADGWLHGSWHEVGRYPITVEGRDRNGFAVRRDYVVSIDDTPPVIEPQLTGTQGESGWYVSAVDVQWSITDPESEIRWSAGCDPTWVQDETADAGFFCHAESAGGTAFKDVHVKVDLMPPQAWVQSFESEGALARIAFDGSDAMSGVAGFECSLDGAVFEACATPLVRTFGPGSHELLIRAIDAAGHRSEPTLKNWFTDATSPQVFADVTGPQGQNDWYIGDVQIQWLVRDDESGIASATGCETTQLTSDALGAGFTCTATSGGGTTEQTVQLRRDTVAPDTRLIATPAEVINASTATFEFDGSDATAGVAGYECRFDSSTQWQPCSSPKRYDNLGHGQHVFYVRAIDAAGHRDELEAGFAFKVDTTAPTITPSVIGTLGNNGWYVGEVRIAWTVEDAESAIASSTGCNAVTLATDTAGASFTCTATNGVGTTVSRTVSVKIDRTAPTLAPAVPAEMLLNASNSAAANGNDALSGVASASCAALATGTVGSKTVTCAVTDRAGNTATGSATYRVVYGFNGFTAPVQNPAVLNVLKAGRSVQLRWRLLDANGAPVSNLTSATASPVAIACPVASENRISVFGGSNGQLQNLGNGYYQLDWMSSTSLRNSCRRLELNLGDGLARPALFKFN